MNKEPKKILIVEDDPFILEMYRAKLASIGYKILVARDGLEGMELVKKDKPNLVVLDIVLPGMGGFEILRALKRDSQLKKISILVLTNLEEKKDMEKGFKLGADDYLVKSYFTPTEVISKIEALLSK